MSSRLTAANQTIKIRVGDQKLQDENRGNVHVGGVQNCLLENAHPVNDQCVRYHLLESVIPTEFRF